MPLYEYECQTCRHRFERIQKFSDPPVASCPECGNEVRKLVSSPAIQFKGSGWYITDYARKGDSGNGGKSRDAATKDTAAPDSKSASQDTTTSKPKSGSPDTSASPPASKTSEK